VPPLISVFSSFQSAYHSVSADLLFSGSPSPIFTAPIPHEFFSLFLSSELNYCDIFFLISDCDSRPSSCFALSFQDRFSDSSTILFHHLRLNTELLPLWDVPRLKVPYSRHDCSTLGYLLGLPFPPFFDDSLVLLLLLRTCLKRVFGSNKVFVWDL